MQNLNFIDYLNTNKQKGIDEDREEIINGLKNFNQKSSILNTFMMRMVQFFLIKLQNLMIIILQKKKWKY